VVAAGSTIKRSFVPIMDTIFRWPNVRFKLRRNYREQVRITEADKVLFVAEIRSKITLSDTETVTSIPNDLGNRHRQ
jgi:predicted GTPase